MPTPSPRTARPLLLVARALALAVVAVVCAATPAAADPPVPGHYTSEVTAVDPPVDGIDLEVVGGDSFLRLEVEPGVEVVVEGYDDEPFLRVLADGTVEQNAASPATYLNDDRYGQVSVPDRLAGVDPAELEPEWESVASGGTWAWHDHRIHWMAPNAPPAVPRGGTFDWNGPVLLVVDGVPVEVSGTILYHHDFSPLPWVGAGIVVAAAGTFLLRGRTRTSAAVAAVVAGAATAVAWATWDLAPPDTGASMLPVVVAVVAVVLSAASVVVPSRYRPIPLLAVAAILGSWGLLRFSVLTNPILPTELPFAFDRATTVAAFAAAVAVGVTGLRAMPSAAALAVVDLDRGAGDGLGGR